MIRLGAVGAVLAGVMWALSGAVAFVFAGTGPADPTGRLYFYLFEGAHTVAGVGILVALVGLHARQTPDYGRLGTAGYLIAFAGAAGGGVLPACFGFSALTAAMHPSSPGYRSRIGHKP